MVCVVTCICYVTCACYVMKGIPKATPAMHKCVWWCVWWRVYAMWCVHAMWWKAFPRQLLWCIVVKEEVVVVVNSGLPQRRHLQRGHFWNWRPEALHSITAGTRIKKRRNKRWMCTKEKRTSWWIIARSSASSSYYYSYYYYYYYYYYYFALLKLYSAHYPFSLLPPPLLCVIFSHFRSIFCATTPSERCRQKRSCPRSQRGEWCE